MKIDWSSILNLLERSPADLVFHLVVGLALALIFISALQRRGASPRSSTQKHLLISVGVLVSLRIFLFTITQLLAIPNLISLSIPCLIESVIHTLTLLWLIWAFIERDDTFFITGIEIFISLALLLGCAVSIGLLLLQPDFMPKDNTWLLTIWDLCALALAALGIGLLWKKRPQGWRVGVAIIITLGIGHGLQLFLTSPDALHNGPVRLAQTLALPWAIILLQRVRDSSNEKPHVQEDDKWDNVRPLLVAELLSLSQLENAEEQHQALARALSLSLVADMCYLVKLEAPGQDVKLLAGYDLIREQPLPTASLPRKDLPNILKAWEEQQPYAPSNPPVETRDAATLTNILNYHHLGNLLAYPLSLEGMHLRGGVIFLSPYTDKTWGKSALNLMDEVEKTLTKFLFEPDQLEKLTAELAAARSQVNRFQQKSDDITQSLSDSRGVIIDQETQIKQLKAKYQIEKLEMVKKIDAFQEKIYHLSSLAASHKQDLTKLDQLKDRIHGLMADRDRLEHDLAQAKTRIIELESQIPPLATPQQPSQNAILSLNALAANVQLAFGPRCQQKDVKLEISNPDEDQLIKIKPDHLQTLINNLMENALLASKPEGSLHFQLNLSFETGLLEVQVTDSGEGLSPEAQQALFSDMEAPPDGIGSLDALREAVRRVQALDGKIWLRSKLGAFTSFRVKLPVRIMD